MDEVTGFFIKIVKTVNYATETVTALESRK